MMTSVGIAPTSGLREPGGNVSGVNRLPDEMNDMKIRDERVKRTFLFYLLGASLYCSL